MINFCLKQIFLTPGFGGVNQFICFQIFSSTSAAGARMVSSIRAALLKGRSNADPVCTAVEDVVNDLKGRIHTIHTQRKESTFETGISPARVKLF